MRELGGMDLIAEVGHEIRDEVVSERGALPGAESIEVVLYEIPGQIGLLARPSHCANYATNDRRRQFVAQCQRQCVARQRWIARAGGRVIIAHAVRRHGAFARQRQQRVVVGAIGTDADDMGDGIA